MTEGLRQLLSTAGWFSHPVTRATVYITGAAIVLALIAGPLLAARGRMSPTVAADVRTRTLTWAVIIPLVLIPILIAPLGAMLLVGILSLLCYREFARATGLFREQLVSALVALGIIGVTLGNIDHWPDLTAAVQAVTLCAIIALSVFKDQPSGYIQRTALGAGAFMLFGMGLGRLGLLAADSDFRPILCAIMLSVQANDVAAYCAGRSIKSGPIKGKWFPATSPGKTIPGHIGAAITTPPLAAYLYHLCFHGSPDASSLDSWPILLLLGLMTSILGQLGDLVISSVKRDVGIKDMGALLPGHGGVLDRCNSLLLVAPAMYHMIEFFRGIIPGVPIRALTGG
jgi:phosphatidate cytidylyltransferase